MKKILLVDDAKDAHLILREAFDGEHIMTSALTLQEATQILSQESFDLILLDIILPDGNGLEFCAKLRTKSQTQNTPVIFISGKNDISSKSIGFSLGAEDYIVKPFDPVEVKLRCNAKLKKKASEQSKSNQLKVGDLRFEIASQRAYVLKDLNEQELDLTPTGFKLLLYLAQKESQVLTRDQLINAVWGEGTFIVDRTVDSHIGALRKELSNSSVSIRAVHGQGYKLSSQSETKSKKKSAA